MKLHLIKPSQEYFHQYNTMMQEWIDSGTHIAPWFLGQLFDREEDFIDFVNRLESYEHKSADSKYPAQSLYFAVDEQGKLIGAGRLAHELLDEAYDSDGKGYNVWGHIGYGVRPSERGKGNGTRIAKCLLEEARKRGILEVHAATHSSNIDSIKVLKNCGGVLDKTITIPDNPEPIEQYIIHIK